jgi:hypothetical protein
MEKEHSKPATGTDKPKTTPPVKDGILVTLVKMFLGLNYLKSGIKKVF